MTEAMYYRWRAEYGGPKLDQVKRLKQLEQENSRLRRAVSDLTLEKLILKEAALGNVWSALPLQGSSLMSSTAASMYPASREWAAVAARP